MYGSADIYSELKEDIQFLAIKPGTKMVEAELSKQFGVSRTPVREALKRLNEEELIEIYPQRGTYVSQIDAGRVKEMAYMRHIIEKEVLTELCRKKAKVRTAVEENLLMMRLAIKNHDCKSYIQQDNQFHRTLFGCQGHEVMWDTVSSYLIQYSRILILELDLEDHLERSLESHEAIVDCIESGREEELMKILEEHHDYRMTESDRTIMSRYPEYFLS